MALLGLGAAATGVFITGAAPSQSQTTGTILNFTGVALIVGGVGLALYEGLRGMETRRLRENPARGSKWSKAKFDRCVRKVKRRGGARNAYAVCTAASRR
jgi:hypothetical protein